MQKLRLLFDRFTLILTAVVITATILPAHGVGATIFEWITTFAIALLFYMHGAKLSREAIIAGATHWRLHLLVFAFTFILFPILGWVMRPILVPIFVLALFVVILHLGALPRTVQSASDFTSMARGNVPAALCSVPASSPIGILLTAVLRNLKRETPRGNIAVCL